jgi:very-short-patch-repair endonuclease
MNELVRLADGRAGNVTVRHALRRGISYEALRHRVDRGELVARAPGVYRLRDHPDTWESRLWGLVLAAGDDAVVSHRSAARLHGLYAYRSTDAVEVTRRRGRDHDVPFGRIHESSALDEEDLVEVDGFVCTSVARTVFDLCGDPDRRLLRTDGERLVHRERMLQVANDALARHGLTVERGLVLLAAVGKRGRPGTALVRELFAEFGGAYVPDASDLETVFGELVRSAGLPRPRKQVTLADGDGVIGRVDFCWPEAALVVEVDSSWHDGPVDRRLDAERDRRLTALGYAVLRVRWADLVVHPERVVRRLRLALEPRNPEAAADPGALAPGITAASSRRGVGRPSRARA